MTRNVDPAGRGAVLFNTVVDRVSVITAEAPTEPDPAVDEQVLGRNGELAPKGPIVWFRVWAIDQTVWLRYWTRRVTSADTPGYVLVPPGGSVNEPMRGRGVAPAAISVAAFDSADHTNAIQIASSVHVHAKTQDTGPAV